MKALIKVGYGCNENCSFCHTLEVRHINGSSEEVHAKIDRAAELGHTMVVFSGGEASIRPELFEWAQHVVERNMDVGLVTNGLMMAYPEYLDRLLKLRLKYVYMSLHGGTAKIHNLLVRAHTFDAAQRALQNLVGKGITVAINTVITKQNVNHLKPVVDLVLPYPELELKFSMVQPKGGGVVLFDQLTPRVSEVGARVHEAITYGLEKTQGKGPRFTHDGIPLCLLPGYERLYSDLKTHDYWTMVEIGEPDFFPVDDKAKVQPSPCDACALRGPCPGLYAGYKESYGSEELKPVTDQPRSNSFNYVFEKLLTTDLPAAIDHDNCPVLDQGITPFDRGRHLYVRNGPRLARFRASSRDFSDSEMESIKHNLGQVYLDASRKAAPDDFRRDLVQLRRSAICEPCPSRDVCTGLHEPLFEDVFGADDERVREIVQGLSGDVLDVGCGEGPYEEVVAPLAKAGRIRYVGIEPDAHHVERLRGRWPWARVEAATAEAFVENPAEAGRYDSVLVLRSWNHLRDPKSAAAGLVRALKPGGQLIVVDNTAFGLARTVQQTNRAEGSPAAFEHYRNDRAAEAERILGTLGLRLIERREVSATTSNQWLFRYEAPATA